MLKATLLLLPFLCAAQPVKDTSPLLEKAKYFQQDLLDKHWLDGLYVSIVPAAPVGTKLPHTVDEPGNVIHAGVWTGRYLAGVGYQYAVTKDRWVRRHGGQMLEALRKLQEMTGKPGLLARGYVKGHGPVEDWERDGKDSREWRQGQGPFADYRWYGDVSVDNFNAVLYGYAIYYDLAADEAQKKFIARDVDRLMTHLLDNQCRIIDVNGEVTLWGHVGIDPDPARDQYYQKHYGPLLARYKLQDAPWRPPLRASLMLLPDLLIAHHITARPRYLEFYRRVLARFKDNPDLPKMTRPTDHSSEGQDYEALYNLIRYERDPELLARYRQWMSDLWEANWMEGNSLVAFMTLARMPKDVTHAQEGLQRALETLRLFPVDRVLRPVMNSLRTDITKPLPINQRPLDNEYEWKGNPYRLDGWLKPAVTAIQFACDDPQVAWFSDSTGRLYMTLDGWKTWQDVSRALMGARVLNIAASKTRTFVLHAQTDQGVFLTRDGGMSWRPAVGQAVSPASPAQGPAPHSLNGWRIPRADYVFSTPRGTLAGGPGGAYLSADGQNWTELPLWREQETGAADFLHAYWMGRFYGYVQ